MAATVARRGGWTAAATLICGSSQVREISALVKAEGLRAFPVDTLALVRKLEAPGMPSNQAEAITSVIVEVLLDSLEDVSQSFVKREIQRSVIQDSNFFKFTSIQDANLSKFKSEVQRSQEHHFSLLQGETEKIRGDIDRMRSELRYEVVKVNTGQRLDLNHERGRILDELAKQKSEITVITTKLYRKIHSLKTQMETAKYDVIKYCIGTLVSITVVGLAIARILM